MKILLILNDKPDSGERAFNMLRLATTLSKNKKITLKVFLLGDAVTCSIKAQKDQNVLAMLDTVANSGAAVGACSTCLNSRGINDNELIRGTHRQTMEDLAAWVIDADKVVTF